MQRVLRPVPVGTDTPVPSVAPPAQSLGIVMSPAPGEYCEAEERTDGHILTSWIVTPALVFNRSMYPLMAGPNICMVELSQAPLAGRIWAVRALFGCGMEAVAASIAGNDAPPSARTVVKDGLALPEYTLAHVDCFNNVH